MTRHEPPRDGEVFLGNCTAEDGVWLREELKHLKTLRLGDQAYSIHGEKLSPDYCRPMFLNKSELALYEYIMTHKK